MQVRERDLVDHRVRVRVRGCQGGMIWHLLEPEKEATLIRLVGEADRGGEGRREGVELR
jgi:hypothetical protein